jgi:hypothetical protein
MTDSYICVAPLSTEASLLPRAHTYFLAAALLFPLPAGWLFRAALATFTIRTSILAIDAAVLLHFNPADHTSPAPADAVVVLETLGLAAIVACWLLLVSPRAKASESRPLIRAWAVVVAIGTALAFTAVAKLGKRVIPDGSKVTCSNQDGTVWMVVDNLLGQPVTVPTLGTIGSKINFVALRVGIPALIFAVIALLTSAFSRDTSQDDRRSADVEFGVSEEIIDVDSGAGSLASRLGKTIGVVLVLAMPAMAFFIVISAEMYLLSMVLDLPSAETMASVGTWGVWAATGIVSLATLFNAVRQKMGIAETSEKKVEATHFPPPDHYQPDSEVM